MTDMIKAALIVTTPPTIVALAGVIKIFKVGRQVNGRLSELLELTRKASKAEGVLQELDRPKKTSKAKR
jgi:hypothetical protein